ncbi:guanine nucleotide-binding protein-like 3 isoform X2 [Hyla sarda]|uniref:guanine nucleotide-binding protein-like 3 isoform X2 n=1 Tax=Hyla sarda TaxID=327740 RepID=UPI0024C44225|nr:guanine nucleotide-binding protein-like 3 isoform X2 [Hyla sarda]
MKRPKLKKASKRMSCSKRFKIQKKVREHKRKVRKEAKKKGINRKPKRDISIPNNAPFKEDILREAEQRKQRREELKNQQKLERQKEVAKKRKLEEKKEKPDEKKQKVKKKPVVAKPKKPAVKNPTRSMCEQVNKVIEAADIILEVLDARDPLGSRCMQAEQAVLQSPNKKLLLVLNKIDLVPRDNLEKWLQFLNNQLPTVAFKCSTQVQERNLPGVGKKRGPNCIDISKGTLSYGAASLLKILRSLCSPQTETIKVGLIGFSNAGKSSLINTLKQYRVCNVGAVRGTTRIMQDVNIDGRIKIIDSPGLVVSPDNPPATLLMRSAFLSDEENHMDGVTKILKHCDKQQIMLRYNVPDYRNPLEFLDLLAHKRGLLKKKGLADLEAAAKFFLNDWMGAKLCYYTQPPASFTSHIDDKLTSAMKKAVNCKIIEEENRRNIKAVRNPTPSSSISFHYSQITNGILDVNEIKVEDQVLSDQEEEEEMEEEEDVNKDEKNEMPDAEEEKSESKEKTVKSVSFDKPAEAENDDYDFNADFN